MMAGPLSAAPSALLLLQLGLLLPLFFPLASVHASGSRHILHKRLYDLSRQRARPSAVTADPTDPYKSFEQVKDHFDPSNNDTFPQQYYVNDLWYKPGSPIFMFVEGEAPQDYETYPAFSFYALAEQHTGLFVALEHRYFGNNSMPVPDLTTANLRWLDSKQAIADGINFLHYIREVYRVPNCTKVVVAGGSYPGNLAAWYRVHHPDVIFAAHASSAPVLAQENFRDYSKAVRLGTANPLALGSAVCSNNYRTAVAAFDKQLKRDFNKTRFDFGLGPLSSWGDIANVATATMASGIQYGPSFPFGSVDNMDISFIGALCSHSHAWFPAFLNPKATEAELYAALMGYTRRWLTSNDFKLNDPVSIGKEFDTKHASKLNRTGMNYSNAAVAWTWMTCNEFGYFQTPEAISRPMFSTYMNVTYYRWICETWFGPKLSKPPVAVTNKVWGGRDIEADNLIWGNGSIDPWHWLSQYKHNNTQALSPVLLHDQFHCTDMDLPSDNDTPLLQRVKAEIVATWTAILATDTCPRSTRST